MKKFVKLSTWLFISVIIFSTLYSCKSNEEKIIGTWATRCWISDDSQTFGVLNHLSIITFNNDGTCTCESTFTVAKDLGFVDGENPQIRFKVKVVSKRKWSINDKDELMLQYISESCKVDYNTVTCTILIMKDGITGDRPGSLSVDEKKRIAYDAEQNLLNELPHPEVETITDFGFNNLETTIKIDDEISYMSYSKR